MANTRCITGQVLGRFSEGDDGVRWSPLMLLDRLERNIKRGYAPNGGRALIGPLARAGRHFILGGQYDVCTESPRSINPL